jgi:hypothetical protein
MSSFGRECKSFAAPGPTGEFDATAAGHYPIDVRQFLYGLILGAAFWYAYERLDPAKILAYLNSATEHAVKSTSGYGGSQSRK